MNRTLKLVILTVASIALIACQREPTLEGKWTAVDVGFEQEVTFYSNLNFTVVSKTLENGKGLIVTETGTWRTTADRMSYIYDDRIYETVGMTTAEETEFQDWFRAQEPQMRANMNIQYMDTIKWKGNDEFVQTGRFAPITYRRK